MSITKPNILLAVIAIQTEQLSRYNKYFRKSHEQYAKKFGYDFKVIIDYIDVDNARPQAIPLNSALIPSISGWDKYDSIIIIDPNIMINPLSPPIHKEMNGKNDKIGLVDECQQTDIPCASQFYKMCDLSINTKHVLGIDVMIVNPKEHGVLLENAYTKHVDNCFYHYRQSVYAKTTIGYEIMDKNKHHILSKQWNILLASHNINKVSVNDLYLTNYFINFKDVPDNIIHLIVQIQT